MRTIRFLAVSAALLFSYPAGAQEGVIDRWYAALLAVDRVGLTELLADDTTIRLEDLGVSQTKSEFIASMDEWEAAAAGAAIRHKVENEDGGATTVLACYDFPDNDALMRETFVVRDGRITRNTQVSVGDGCEGL